MNKTAIESPVIIEIPSDDPEYYSSVLKCLKCYAIWAILTHPSSHIYGHPIWCPVCGVASMIKEYIKPKERVQRQRDRAVSKEPITFMAFIEDTYHSNTSGLPVIAALVTDFTKRRVDHFRLTQFLRTPGRRGSIIPSEPLPLP